MPSLFDIENHYCDYVIQARMRDGKNVRLKVTIRFVVHEGQMHPTEKMFERELLIALVKDSFLAQDTLSLNTNYYFRTTEIKDFDIISKEFTKE